MSIDTCDHCPSKWSCETPCQKVIAWQELEDKDRIHHRYKTNEQALIHYEQIQRHKLRLEKG